MIACPTCGREFAKRPTRHMRNCFTTIAEFAQVFADRLRLAPMSGCVTMVKLDGSAYANRPVDYVRGGTRLAVVLLEMKLERSLEPFPKEVAMHTCDNPACVNWWHLVVGSSADNAKDMHDKGRHVNSPLLERYEAVLDALPGTRRDLMAKTGLAADQVSRALKFLMKQGRAAYDPSVANVDKVWTATA